LVFGCWRRWCLAVGVVGVWLLASLVFGCWRRWCLAVGVVAVWLLASLRFGCWRRCGLAVGVFGCLAVGFSQVWLLSEFLAGWRRGRGDASKRKRGRLRLDGAAGSLTGRLSIGRMVPSLPQGAIVAIGVRHGRRVWWGGVGGLVRAQWRRRWGLHLGRRRQSLWYR
jgi:hypothetical protein